MSFLPHWVNWNFTGYEGNDDWSDIEALYSSLEKLPPGRIMWEPNSELNKYGTPMVLMTIPLFTEHTSIEELKGYNNKDVIKQYTQILKPDLTPADIDPKTSIIYKVVSPIPFFQQQELAAAIEAKKKSK